MLNRRQLRIKILQSLYAYFQSENENYNAGLKELMHSISKMYDMYIYYLLVYKELAKYAESKIEETKNRKFSKVFEEELNRNFIDNPFIQILSNNPSLLIAAEKLKINWDGDVEQDVIKKLFNYIAKTDTYNEIMTLKSNDFEAHKTLCIKLFKKEICNYHLMHNFFEEKSIYWTDDIDHVCSMIIKSMKAINTSNAHSFAVLPLWKDDEEEFTNKFCDFQGGGYADAVSSGGAAVYIALKALDIKPGSDVIISPTTNPGGVMPVAIQDIKLIIPDSEKDRFNISISGLLL